VLFVHEFHTVVGKRAADFETHVRDGWMPLLGQGTDARLAWYFDLAHGSGLAYRVVTVTAVRDGPAYVRLAERVARGDLRAWAQELDGLQHESLGRVLTPLPWSPPFPDLEELPTGGVDREPTMYMEDTVWPFPGLLRRYVTAAGEVYRPSLAAADARMQMSVALGLEAMPGAGRSPEVTLLQRLPSLPRLLDLLTQDLPPETTAPGSWMHEALDLRDRWRSRLLRTAPWSPLP
jgi:hypothetical protein